MTPDYTPEELKELDSMTPEKMMKILSSKQFAELHNIELVTFHGNGNEKTRLTIGEYLESMMRDYFIK